MSFDEREDRRGTSTWRGRTRGSTAIWTAISDAASPQSADDEQRRQQQLVAEHVIAARGGVQNREDAFHAGRVGRAYGADEAARAGGEIERVNVALLAVAAADVDLIIRRPVHRQVALLGA